MNKTNDKPQMTYSQAQAALKLMDAINEFQEQYYIPERWATGIKQSAKLAAQAATGLNTDEA